MKRPIALFQATFSLFLILLLVGCATPSVTLKLAPPEETDLELVPVDAEKIAYLDSLSRANALARQKQVSALARAEEKEQRKTKSLKLARVKLLAELAEKQHQEKKRRDCYHTY